MDRLQKIKAFSIESLQQRAVPGTEKRDELLREQVFDLIKTYNPETVCMAGVSHGELLLHVARESEALLVLVEHSLKAIEDFQEMHRANPLMGRIYFIQGDFNNFPIDYYAANLLISIDNISYLESGIVIDEFRRSLDFDGILLVATCLTCETDIDGKLDEVMRAGCPLHNEFYMSDELKTVMDLNEFKFVRGSETELAVDVDERGAFFSRVFDTDSTEMMRLLEENRSVLTECYHLTNHQLQVPYYAGVFMRIKPEYLKRDMAGQL